MKRTLPKIIYTHGGGRLGNQLIRWLHWLAWARANEGCVEVINLAFWPYAASFAVWREYPGCIFPLRHGLADRIGRWRTAMPAGGRIRGERRIQQLVHAIGGWLPGGQAMALDDKRAQTIDLDDPAFLSRIAGHRVTTCSGWKIAGWRHFAAHQTALREFFRPAPKFARSSTAFIATLRAQYDVLVGLFIRQTDYKTWHDGRFWFSSAQYAVWMRQLLDLLGGRRVAFVVAADERIDPEVFAGLPCHFATGTVNAGGHWFCSFAELSLCDFIVSPPSTFAAAAAYAGAVPLWPVVAAGQPLAFDQMLVDAMVDAARHKEFSLAVK
jgi:hypothetical protein